METKTTTHQDFPKDEGLKGWKQGGKGASSIWETGWKFSSSSCSGGKEEAQQESSESKGPEVPPPKQFNI